jgi:hypothetical protein
MQKLKLNQNYKKPLFFSSSFFKKTKKKLNKMGGRPHIKVVVVVAIEANLGGQNATGVVPRGI